MCTASCDNVDDADDRCTCYTESGRNALMEADGIHLLYNTCLETSDCRELESVIYLASVIMRKCFPKSRLPITTLRNPLTFPIPDSDVYGTTSEVTEGICCQLLSLSIAESRIVM